MSAEQTPAVITGPEAYRRACDLLEQAFATHTVSVGDPWNSAPEIRSVLPDGERNRYIAAAQAYAALAQASATVEIVASRGPGDVDWTWQQVLGQS